MVIHPVKWVLGSFTWVKAAERDVDHSLLSSAVVRSEWSYTSLPPHRPSWLVQRQLYFFDETEENFRPQVT